MSESKTPTVLLLVTFDDERGAERAVRLHWHARQHHLLSWVSGCVVRRHKDGHTSYVSVRDVTPRSVDWYGGIVGYAVACLLVVPLVVGGDEIHATAFGGAVSEDCRSALRAALPPDSSAILFLIRPEEMSAAKAEAESLGGKPVFVEIEAGTARQLADAINGELVDSGAGR